MRALEQARLLLETVAQNWSVPESDRLDAQIAAADLPGVVSTLEAQQWGYLIALTGLDNGAEAGDMEVLYHFGAGAAVLTLRVTIPREQAVVPSISRIIPYASVLERELGEMFGIEISGTPDPSRLYLPDDWQEGVYPLRKDVKLD